MRFEYKVMPAPTRGKKAKGVKGAAGRFAQALSDVMNELAADGWEYLRTDTLPAEERAGLTGRTTVFQNMLVFRRAVQADAEAPLGDSPEPAQPEAETADGPPKPIDSDNLFAPENASDIADTHAPKLPSAKAAQTAPEAMSAPKPADKKPEMAAE